MADLLPFLLIGLLGAAHCAGMCGGFAVLVGLRGGSGGRGSAAHLLLYAAGKATSYATLGLAASLSGRWASERWIGGELVAGSRRGVAWFAGALLCFMGLRAMGLVPLHGPRAIEHLLRPLRAAWNSLSQIPGRTGSFGIGLANGLLPCGLSWAALLLALRAPPPIALAGMALFGLATAPVLGLVGLGAGRGLGRLAQGGRRLLGPALIALGVLTALRGGIHGAGPPGDASGTGAHTEPAAGPGAQSR